MKRGSLKAQNVELKLKWHIVSCLGGPSCKPQHVRTHSETTPMTADRANSIDGDDKLLVISSVAVALYLNNTCNCFLTDPNLGPGALSPSAGYLALYLDNATMHMMHLQ